MSHSCSDWVECELGNAQLGDARLNRRFQAIAVQLAKQCGKTVASSFTQWKSIKAAYRFFANPKVTINAMLEPHIEQTVHRITGHDTVLLLQDTTYLDYNNRPKTDGLDLTFRTKQAKASHGLMLHNTLAVSVDGVPLGLLDQRFIERKAFNDKSAVDKRKNRHWNRPIEEKESIRWINVVKTSRQFDFGRTQIVHVADRECDLYEFYRDAAALGEKVLIRAAKNRSINKVHRREAPKVLLFDYLKKKRTQGKLVINVQANTATKYREATLSIVRAPITMPPPPNKTVNKDGAELPMVPLHAIMAIERHPPHGQTAIFWVLLTNMAVDTLDDAIEKVGWYAQRWNIEVFHKVLKSGCGVENAQLRHAHRLKNYIVLKSIMAWRLFWLDRAHKHTPSACSSTVLSQVEWTVLYKKIHKVNQAPNAPPTVAQALLWIAKLGGYIDRASDPPPGLISLWRGWQRLMDMVEDFEDIYG